MSNKVIYSLFALLIFLAIWEELVRERRGKNLLKNEYRDTIHFVPSALQGILDYFFNKFAIRQILNPWFLFPASILFTLYFAEKISRDTQDIVLLITFFAVMWYSRETYALRNEQKKTNGLIAGRPLILIAKEIEGDKISIKNAGNNIARNIIVSFIMNDELKEKYKFISCGIDQEIPYPIPEYLVNLINGCDPVLRATITYYNFQKDEQFETIYRTDETVVIKPNIGRFAEISDQKIMNR